MLSVWPVLVVDFEFRPKILKQMILEGGVPNYRITEVLKFVPAELPFGTLSALTGICTLIVD